MTFEHDDNVESGATENTAAEVETEQTQGQEQVQEPEQAQDDEHGDGTEKQEPEPEKPKKDRARERIQQLAREKAEMAAKLAEYEAKAQQPQVEDQPPQIADFDSYDDYLKAKDEWTIDQAAKRIEEKQSKQQQTQESARREAEFITAADELVSEGVDIAAYIEKSKSLPPLPVMLDQIGLSAKESLLLAKNLIDDQEAYLEISQMTPVQALMRIGQIIAKPKAVAPKVSKAPPPVKPVKANASTKRDEKSMSDAEATAYLRSLKKK